MVCAPVRHAAQLRHLQSNPTHSVPGLFTSSASDFIKLIYSVHFIQMAVSTERDRAFCEWRVCSSEQLLYRVCLALYDILSGRFGMCVCDRVCVCVFVCVHQPPQGSQGVAQQHREIIKKAPTHCTLLRSSQEAGRSIRSEKVNVWSDALPAGVVGMFF